MQDQQQSSPWLWYATVLLMVVAIGTIAVVLGLILGVVKLSSADVEDVLRSPATMLSDGADDVPSTAATAAGSQTDGGDEETAAVGTLRDFATLREWAATSVSQLGTTAHSMGNVDMVRDRCNQLQEELEPLFGQPVRWPLPVKQVTESHVYLESMYLPGLVLAADSSLTGDSTFAALQSAISGETVIALEVGRDISRERAHQLTRTQPLLVAASVDQAAIQPYRGEYIVRVDLSSLTAVNANGLTYVEQLNRDIIDVSVDELVTAMENELVWESQYEGKRVRVSGLLSVSPFGVSIVDEQPTTKKNARIVCGFDDSRPRVFNHESDKTGLPVTVTGTCILSSLGVLGLTHCQLVTSRAELEAMANERQRQAEEARQERLRAAEAVVRRGVAVAARESIVATLEQPQFARDKIVEATGTVDRVFRSGGVIHVWVRIPYANYRVDAAFQPWHEQELAGLSAGQQIILRGRGPEGAFIGIDSQMHLTNCVLMDMPTVAAEPDDEDNETGAAPARQNAESVEIRATRPSDEKQPPAEKLGPLSGTWRSEKDGRAYTLVDDGQRVEIRLVGEQLQGTTAEGVVTRREDYLAGEIVFTTTARNDRIQKQPYRITMWILDDGGRLRVKAEHRGGSPDFASWIQIK